MDFLIIQKRHNQVALRHSFVDSFKDIEREGIYIKKLGHLDYVVTTKPQQTVLEFGDVIEIHNSSTGRKKGIYYTIAINNDCIIVEADTFGFLPVFYAEINDLFVVSSSFKMILGFMELKNEDPEFYHQMAFFFTPIGGTTAVKGVSRLEYGANLEIGAEGVNQKKIRGYSDFLTSIPKSFKESIYDVVDCFIANSKHYLEDDNAIALTGGYDGRSIVACAHHFNKRIHAFSYGKRGSLDVEVPILIADKLAIDYRLLQLGEDYLENYYEDCVHEYITRSGGLNGFLYPQSLYYVKELSKEYGNIATGYVGSEIIRSSKEPDCEVVPPVVFHYLSGDVVKAKQWIASMIPRLTQIQLLNGRHHPDDTLQLIDSLQKAQPNDLTANQKLFTYLYEHCFMNLFGTWVHNGMYYAKIRVPFLDSDYFNLVSKTKVSAFYLDFPERDMRKRLKSCSYYAYLYDRTWPELGKIPISKGYTPKQLIRPLGSISVALAYAKAKRTEDPNGLDKLSSVSGALKHIDKLKQDNSDNKDLLDSIWEFVHGDSYSRSHGFMALSKIETERMFFN